MKIDRNVSQRSADLALLLKESVHLKENLSPQRNILSDAEGGGSGKLLGETRKKNHFGISREELDCDEQENVGWRVRANVFEGDYDSARPFKEAIWRREAIDLERQLDEQTKRLQQIRLQCSADFDAKLKKHLQDCAAKQSVSPLHGATITVKHEQSALSVLTTSIASAPNLASGSVSTEPPSVHNPAADVSSSQFLQTSGPSCSSSSSLFPCDSCATTQPFISNTSRVARAPTGTRFSKFESYSGGFGLTSENSSSLFDAKQVGSSNSDIEKRFSEKRDEGLEINEKKKSEFSSADEIYDSMSNLPHSDFARPSKTSSALVKESSLVSTFKSGHPALVRTDSRSAQSLFSTSGGAHTSHPVPKVLEHKNEPRSEEQKTVPTVNESDGGPRTEQISGEAKTMNVLEVASKDSPKAEHHLAAINRPTILDKWIKFKNTFEADIREFSASSHNSVRADLKYTINERTAVWTKKYAKEDEIKQAARFFTDLLSGITVFGFRGKHINLKGEDDARGWAFAHIVSAYINLVVQDLSLVDVAAAVLSRVAFQWEEFTSFLFGKLCASSLLLSMQFHRCEEKMVELSKRGEEASEAAAAWGARENALVRLFAAIHADRTVNEVDRQGQQCPFTGAPLLWLLAVATLKQRSPFAAALLSGLLTQSGWVLRESYKKQFDKLLAVIGEKVIPAWGKTLEATPVSDVVCSCQRMWVASLKDSYDRGYFLRKPSV